MPVGEKKQKEMLKKRTGRLWHPQVGTNFASASEKHLRQTASANTANTESLSDASGEDVLQLSRALWRREYMNRKTQFVPQLIIHTIKNCG